MAETEHFLALTPYAGRFAYELWLAPKAHQRDFGEMSAEERQELAVLLRKMLGRVMGIREDIGYNICVMDGPRDTDFHWHIEILRESAALPALNLRQIAISAWSAPKMPQCIIGKRKQNKK